MRHPAGSRIKPRGPAFFILQLLTRCHFDSSALSEGGEILWIAIKRSLDYARDDTSASEPAFFYFLLKIVLFYSTIPLPCERKNMCVLTRHRDITK